MTDRFRLARIKIDWAKRHLDQLEVVKKRFMDRDPYGSAVETDLDFGKHLFKMLYVEPPDPDIALIAGDVIHNTRTALDHLAWQLVLAGGGTPSDQTCFPIAKSAAAYKTLDARKIDGMTTDAKDAIHATEPYQGGKGHDLWVLHNLDIADKHHALLTTVSSLGRAALATFDAFSPYRPLSEIVGEFSAPGLVHPLKAGEVFFICDADKCHDVQFTFEISLSEPCIGQIEPIVPYLSLLIDSVETVFRDCRDLLV